MMPNENTSEKDILYIVIPAYNEEKNIKKCIEEWYPIVERYHGGNQSRLMVIDDGSKDSTYSLLCEYAKTHPLLLPVTKKNGGHGQTVIYGYEYAKDKADYIFQTDADGQTSSSEFIQFWNLRIKYDAILGCRKVRGDGLVRRFVQFMVCVLLFLIFGIKVKDANAPFRLMKTTIIKKYINKFPKDYNLPNIMLTTYFVYNQESVMFLPITFRNRQAGKNSIDIKKIFQIGQRAVSDFIRFRKEIG